MAINTVYGPEYQSSGYLNVTTASQNFPLNDLVSGSETIQLSNEGTFTLYVQLTSNPSLVVSVPVANNTPTGVYPILPNTKETISRPQYFKNIAVIGRGATMLHYCLGNGI